MNSADRSVISLLPPPSLPRFLPRRRHPTDRARRLVYLSLFAPPFLIFLPSSPQQRTRTERTLFLSAPTRHTTRDSRPQSCASFLSPTGSHYGTWKAGVAGPVPPPLLSSSYTTIEGTIDKKVGSAVVRLPTRQSLVVVRYTGGNKWQKLNIFCLSKSL